MAKKDNIIDPPRRVSEKVPRVGGQSPESAIRRSLNSRKELVDSYETSAVDDLQKLWQEHEAMKDQTPIGKDRVARIFDFSHEARGQGGSFGYPLVSLIADSLCKFVEPKEQLDDEQLNIVQLHLLALKAVFRQRLKGQQPEMGSELTKLFAAIRTK